MTICAVCSSASKAKRRAYVHEGIPGGGAQSDQGAWCSYGVRRGSNRNLPLRYSVWLPAFRSNPRYRDHGEGHRRRNAYGRLRCPRHIAKAYQPGDHGTTFGGSCLAVAAATATLDTLSNGFQQHVQETGEYMRQQLAGVSKVKEVRGVGLMNAIDLDESVDAPALVQKALGKGLLLNATGRPYPALPSAVSVREGRHRCNGRASEPDDRGLKAP